MTSDPRTMDGDPVTAALTDAAVRVRLLAAARAFLALGARMLALSERNADAEAILSATIERVLMRQHDYDPAWDVVAWIIGFTKNVAREHLREKGRTPSGPPLRAPQLEDLAIDLGRPVADAVANKDFVERLMTNLKPDERRLLEMKYTEDMTFAEIAARLGGNVTESAVRVRHHRLLQRLQKQYGVPFGEGQP